MPYTQRVQSGGHLLIDVMITISFYCFTRFFFGTYLNVKLILSRFKHTKGMHGVGEKNELIGLIFQLFSSRRGVSSERK